MSILMRTLGAIALSTASIASADPFLSGAKQVSAGLTHSCALMRDGTVACWGSNSVGELGDGTRTPRATPARVKRSKMPGDILDQAVQVVAAAGFSCALMMDASVYCWGDNNVGELGNTSAGAVDVAIGIRSIEAGEESTCAMLADYRIGCWGGNGYGQLGIGTTAPSNVPTILGPTKIASLSVGAYHACAVLPDTTVECWGQGRYGQLGNGSFNDINPSPVHVVDF